MTEARGTQYARTVDGLDIAFQVHGDGPLDLLVVPGIISHAELEFEQPGFRHFVDSLAGFARVIRFDKRGNGLSDRVVGAPSLEERIDDARAVLDAVGSSQAALLGISEGGPMSMLFAATYPTRVRALVLYGTFARFMAAPDYPHGVTPSRLDFLCNHTREHWGTGAGCAILNPSIGANTEALRLAGQLERLSATPATMVALWRLNASIDVRPVLTSVQAPTLVVHRRGDPAKIERGRDLAERIPGARIVELDGIDHFPWFGDTDAVIDAIEEFLTGHRHEDISTDRLLATVVFSDIVASTLALQSVGDRRWRTLLDQHDMVIDRQLERFRGRKVKATGDGVLAVFDGPGRAVRFAAAARDGLRGIGLEARFGVHAGEVELRGDDVSGIAVHVAQRIESSADAGEVRVSRTVVDLVAGSGLQFDDRGEVELRGMSGPTHLFAMSDQ